MFLFGTSFLHFETYLLKLEKIRGIPGHASGKEPVCQCRRCRVTGLIPELERSPGRGHHNPLQYSGLENSMDRGAWRAMVHGVTKSWTQLKQLSPHHRKYKKKKERERERKSEAFLASYHITRSVSFLDFTFEMEHSGF